MVLPFGKTAEYVEEWYESTKAWEASGGASSTTHVLLLLKAVLASVDMKHFKKGYTPLHALARVQKSKNTRCAEEKGVDMLGSVKLLQKCGLDIGTDLWKGSSPVHHAVGNGHLDLVKGLVEAGSDINAKCGKNWTPLAIAASLDDPLILGYLLRRGAKVEGNEAMHKAAFAGSPHCIKALLKAGGMPNGLNRVGRTVAQVCCAGRRAKTRGRGRAEALGLLLESGADVKVNDTGGNSLLHLAVLGSNVHCIALLLESGLQIDARNDHRSTPLHLAGAKGNVACVKEVIRCGASLDLVERKGYTALMLCVRGGHEEIVPILIHGGASVQAKANHSLTALHLAAALGSMEMAYLLVEAGADVSALAKNEETPLMTCMRPDDSKVYADLSLCRVSPGAKEARERVAEFLLKMGAAVDAKVIGLAAEKGFGHVLASFLSKGRDKTATLADRLGAVAEHYSVTVDGDDERVDNVVQVRLVNKATGERGGKQYTLSIPLVEQLMAKLGKRGGEDGKSDDNDSSAAGILPTMLDPAKRGFKAGKEGEEEEKEEEEKGKGKGKKPREIELEYDGVNFTEEGFEAVVKFVTTGSVEELLTRRPRSAEWIERGASSSSGGEGREMRGSEEGGSSSGGVRKECAKLFDQVRAKQTLQAADFFCLEGLSREVKALMGEFGFKLQEEQKDEEGGATEEGQPPRKRARRD